MVDPTPPGAQAHPLAPLLAYRQWIIFKLAPRANGKTDKTPLDARTGYACNAHNPEVWLDYGAAATTAQLWGAQYTVGFVLTANDPFWCLDIDGALQADGTWSPLSQQLCSALPGTVIEVSQSGKGLHVWGQGVVPPHRKKRVDLGIELYTEGQPIAIGSGWVGDMTRPCPTIGALALTMFPPVAAGAEIPDDGPCAEWRGPKDDDDLIRRALQSRSANATFGHGATFADLWDRNVAVLARAYPPDASSSKEFDYSSADMALASHLAFWTGKDVKRIERLMRRSKLYRPKWDEREDYFIERTIMGACGRCTQVCQDKPIEPAPVPALPASSPVAAAAAAAATELAGYPAPQPITGATFLGAQEQLELFKGCVYIVGAHRALVPGGSLRGPDQFRSQFGGYTFAMDARNERTTRNAWEAFTESQVLKAPRADGTCFRPDLPYGTIVTDAGRTRANTWWPVDVPRRQGDATLFLTHLAKLLPDERDRTIILSYMAACVQHKGVKFQWAPVIQGVEGNGKTLLSRWVAEAVGRRYVHWPKASKLGKDFNAWMVGKLFYAVEDI